MPGLASTVVPFSSVSLLATLSQGMALAAESWRDYAGVHVAAGGFEDLGLRVNPALELRSYCCSSCSRLLSVDCCAAGEPHPHDVRLHFPGAAT